MIIIYIHTHTHTHTHISMHIYIHIYIYIYIYIYIRIYEKNKWKSGQIKTLTMVYPLFHLFFSSSQIFQNLIFLHIYNIYIFLYDPTGNPKGRSIHYVLNTNSNWCIINMGLMIHRNIHIHICIHIYTYIYIYILIYTHTHAYIC